MIDGVTYVFNEMRTTLEDNSSTNSGVRLNYHMRFIVFFKLNSFEIELTETII